ncbi:MAG: hypothetical protein CML06_09570 [Pseudomonadales bacterium]|nr:hypothetical protein [Pseudomonadales bacterium]
MTANWIVVDQPQLRQRLRQLGLDEALFAGYWSGEQSGDAEPQAVLEYRDGVLQLRPLDRRWGHPLVVDFGQGRSGFRMARAHHEMLVKAVTGRARDPLRVVDATAGLGRDTMLLGAAGFQVTAIERHPLVAGLLSDGLERARLQAESAPVAERVELVVGRAQALLETWPPASRPDVVYLDPMFPARSKAALVKKEMRLFGQLLGEDMDSASLLPPALAAATRKVVVKRPRKAPPLGGQEPGYRIEGKSSRFDVYPVTPG